MSEKSVYVFLYGTLRMGEPNHNVIEGTTNGSATFIGHAKTVKKWPLIIASRYNIPYLLYAEGQGENVLGEIYEVNGKMLSSLDELECHPDYYTRLKEEVQIVSENELCGEVIQPWIYFFKKYRAELLELPFLSEYSSKGSHGLEYVESEETSNPEDVYS